ncbi:MAG: PAS domain S-box protein [Phycisphaerae bacterium]|nr:PAS domain S-box protein [Phycisphaerae bacterium]
MPGRPKKKKQPKSVKSPHRRTVQPGGSELRHERTEENLQKSELLYQTLMKHIHLGITLIDTNYKVVTTNTGQGKILNKPHSKLVGKYCFREFEKRKAVCSHCPGTQAMAMGHPAEVETIGVRDDGSRVPARVQAFPVFGSDGTVQGFLEVVEDISGRKQAEEKLKESEKRFKTIFDNAPDGMLLTDVKSKKFHMGNKAICKMLGYTPEEIKNLTVWDITPKELSSYAIEQFEKLARGEISLAGDGAVQVKRKDGSILYVAISAFPITLEGKTYITGVLRDVTEHKKAEESLRTSEAQLANAMNIAKLGYWEYDVAEDMFTFNDYFYSIFRTSAEKVGGYKMSPERYARQFIHPDDASMLETETKKAVESTDPNYSRRLEHRIIYADGEIGYIVVRFFVVKDKQGRTIKTFGANQDITESKKAEEELNIYREKMARAERLASLGTLSATLAHELTQPLTVIRLSLENSLDDLEAASGSQVVLDMLKDGLKEVSTATSVVDRFRNYARQSSRKTLCQTNISAIAGRIIQLLDNPAQRAKTTLHLKGMDKLPTVCSNEKDLEQLFFTLTENAIQAADGRKPHQLTIEGVVKGGNIELRFADNCAGIAPENLNKIFDPFFTTGSDDGRTGLGLPIAQRIVSESGGKIRVQSRPGKGTTFYITLPIHSETVK